MKKQTYGKIKQSFQSLQLEANGSGIYTQAYQLYYIMLLSINSKVLCRGISQGKQLYENPKALSNKN